MSFIDAPAARFMSKNVSDPLYQIERDARMTDIAAHHADLVAALYPSQAKFARALVPALNFNLHPALPVLASLVIMKEQFDRQRYGIMKPLAAVRLPLSILARRNGQLIRFLTTPVALLRQSWLTFNMAMKNRPLLDEVCARFGVCLLTTCCCSIILTGADDAAAVLNSPLVRQQDFVRSAADRLATPVHLLADLADIPADNADLTADEMDSFARFETLLDRLALTPALPDPALIQAKFDELKLMAGRTPAYLV